MKIIILLSAGILILTIILLAVRCSKSDKSEYTVDKKNVTISLRAVTEDGKKRLKLSDSNGNTATDHLITEVLPGAKITWIVVNNGNIKSIDSIISKKPGGVIFIKDAKKIDDKKFELIVPDSVPSGTQEGYKIVFTHIDNNNVIIDPYIRIE